MATDALNPQNNLLNNLGNMLPSIDRGAQIATDLGRQGVRGITRSIGGAFATRGVQATKAAVIAASGGTVKAAMIAAGRAQAALAFFARRLPGGYWTMAAIIIAPFAFLFLNLYYHYDAFRNDPTGYVLEFALDGTACGSLVTQELWNKLPLGEALEANTDDELMDCLAILMVQGKIGPLMNYEYDCPEGTAPVGGLNSEECAAIQLPSPTDEGGSNNDLPEVRIDQSLLAWVNEKLGTPGAPQLPQPMFDAIAAAMQTQILGAFNIDPATVDYLLVAGQGVEGDNTYVVLIHVFYDNGFDENFSAKVTGPDGSGNYAVSDVE